MGTVAEFLGSSRRRGAIVVGLTAIVVLAGLPFIAAPPARGASFTLYGDAGRGWGTTPVSIMSPGPLLTVTRGEMVDLSLFSADGATHTWCIDYNGNNGCDAGENESSQFFSSSTPLFHMFYPTGAPGTYNYVCGIHGGFVMNGPITITAAVKPVVKIAAPGGAPHWTGGSSHDIVWTMTDPDDPVTSLRAWVNYTIGGPWIPIAGPIAGSTNPHSVTWTVPLVNATARVNVTAQDPAGNRAWAEATGIVIDSSAPSVIGGTPPNGSMGQSTATNVIATFDEAMNETATATPVTAALQDLSTFAWIPVTYSWGGGDTVLTMDPVPTLAPLTMYRASINVSAKDASDPGNALSAASAWTFTTASGADLEKPQISNVGVSPSVAEYPNPVGVTATITDNDQVAFAFVNVTRPNMSRLNLSMAVVSGTLWGRSQVYATTPVDPAAILGNYLFSVEAVDLSGNWNSSGSGGFVVQDTTAPALSGLTISPSPAEVYQPALVSVSVSEPFLLDVSLAIESGNLTMSFNPTTSKWEKSFVPSQEKTYTFTIWAEDIRGNIGSLPGSVVARDTQAPPMPMGLVASYVAGVGVDIHWPSVVAPDLAGYRLYRSTSPSGPFTAQVGPALIAGNAYLDTTVAAGTTYYYVVTAVDQGGRASMESNIASVSVPASTVDYIPVIIVGVAVLVIVVAISLALILLRRRRKGA